ncbi:hypothetical protein D3C86_1932180 [compost metagenome]
MLHQDHHHRVEHAQLVVVRRQPAEDLQEGHLAEVQLADDLVAQVEAMDYHAFRRGPGDVRFDFLEFHGVFLVWSWGFGAV